MSEKIQVQNINVPGYVTSVNKEKYDAMCAAYVSVLPKGAPGLTAAQAKEALKPLLPDVLFPQGATSGWWLKTVQLDLEAKGIVARESSKPLRFHLVTDS